jgi:hypothetical protein
MLKSEDVDEIISEMYCNSLETAVLETLSCFTQTDVMRLILAAGANWARDRPLSNATCAFDNAFETRESLRLVPAFRI